MVSFCQKLRNISTTNRAIATILYFSLFCCLISIFGLLFDHRLIDGELAWSRTCKFSISLTTLGLTLAWFSSYIERHKEFFQLSCKSAAIGAVIELTAIIIQVYGGTTSYLNTSTLFDHLMLAVTRAAILPVAFAIVSLFIMLVREPNLPSVLGLALRWAAFLAILGMVPGVLMLLTGQTQQVITSYKQIEGHTVGLAQATAGLPFLGWSMLKGDLRPAHFMGLHALQIMPWIGFIVLRALPNLPARRQRFLIWNAGLTYSACLFILTAQALAAESIAAPSLATIIFVSAVFSISFFSATYASQSLWASG